MDWAGHELGVTVVDWAKPSLGPIEPATVADQGRPICPFVQV